MNMSIKCFVEECKHNQCSDHYCMLSKIEVSKGTGSDKTDCKSFECK